MIFLYIIGALLVIILLIFARKLLQLKSGNRRVAKEIAAESQEKLGDIGQVSTLSILPLIDFHTSDSRLKTEPGVSYQVRAGDTTILLDVGFNKKKEHPSALLNNAEVLGVNFQNLDAIFISHLHLDHVGGMAEQRQGQFSFSQGPTTLPEIPVYVPVPISPSHYNPKPEPRLISRPQKLAEGIASIGTIPRNLFLLGYTLEHSLAVNVAGKGIVLVIGCGHQTIEKIIERAQRLFDEPIYGIIGGLHYPVKGGRIMLGPVNLQNLVGNDRPPWKPISVADVDRAIDAMKAVDPQFVALSPHDSSDWSLNRFKQAFGDRYHDLIVGQPLNVAE